MKLAELLLKTLSKSKIVPFLLVVVPPPPAMLPAPPAPAVEVPLM